MYNVFEGGPSCPFKLAREFFIVLFDVHMGNIVLAKISTNEVV
jgi:hypothetical protein